MTETDIAKRIAELPLEKRALLFQQLQKQREKEQAQAPEVQRIPRRPRESETYPLSFAQQRLWFLGNFDPDSPEYNIPQAFRIEGDLDREVMQRALREVVRRVSWRRASSRRARCMTSRSRSPSMRNACGMLYSGLSGSKLLRNQSRCWANESG